MKKIITLLFIVIAVKAGAQTRKERGEIQCITCSSVQGLVPFLAYLKNELNYKTPSNEVQVMQTKGGFYTDFTTTSTGYNPEILKMRIFVKSNTGDSIEEVKITAPFSMLAEVYIKYFEGEVQPNFPKNGGLDKTYNARDEIRLYYNYILIRKYTSINGE